MRPDWRRRQKVGRAEYANRVVLVESIESDVVDSHRYIQPGVAKNLHYTGKIRVLTASRRWPQFAGVNEVLPPTRLVMPAPCDVQATLRLIRHQDGWFALFKAPPTQAARRRREAKNRVVGYRHASLGQQLHEFS